MNLKRVLKPQSVVVIGASQNETKRGYQAIKTLQRDKYEGDIYAVNPKGGVVLGVRCYRHLHDIKGTIDLALIATPSTIVPEILEDCGQKGLAGAVVIAGGFGELGADGKDNERFMVEIAQKYNMRIIGPNTSGIINVHENLNLVGIQDVPRGDIALLTQSGNIALHLITEARLKSHKGFSYYVGIGNEADVKFHEYLQFFTDDKHTKTILVYVEGMRDGRKFLQQVYKTSLKKPIVLLKGGRSLKGQQAAGSHTGALAGMSAVAKMAFERAGIICIENVDELFPAAETLSSLPPIGNNKVAVLADGGGHATIAADLLSDHGIEIPKLEKGTENKLKAILPTNASTCNPVDVAGGTDSNPVIFADCARVLLQDKNVGGLLIVGLFGGYSIRFAKQLEFIEEDAAHQMGKLVAKTGKPIVLQSLYNSAKTHSLELLRYYGIPVYESLEISCKCIGVLSEYGRYLSTYHQKNNFVLDWSNKAKRNCQTIINKARKEGRRVLLEHECKLILKKHQAAVDFHKLAKNAQEAVAIAKEYDGEVALKIVSPDILHKSDAGCVKLHLKTAGDVKKAFAKIVKNARQHIFKPDIRGCLVCGMADKGIEVIIGTKTDSQFGPVIMFGVGGILVEVLKDVSFGVLPISRKLAKTMIEEIKSARILNGIRGNPPIDKESLVKLLVIVSEIMEAYPQIQEMDLNPVIVREKGLTIVDARIILHQN